MYFLVGNAVTTPPDVLGDRRSEKNGFLRDDADQFPMLPNVQVRDVTAADQNEAALTRKIRSSIVFRAATFSLLHSTSTYIF